MYDLDLQLFSDKIRELRIEKKLTQAQFVEDLDVTASALSAYEKGTKIPSIAVVKKIAEKYDVSIDWLCGLTEDKNLKNNFVTYGDVIKALFEIDRYIDLVLEIDKENDYPYFTFDNFELSNFLREWKEATDVLYNTSINKEITKTMYNSWEKSKLEELGNKKLKKKKSRN